MASTPHLKRSPSRSHDRDYAPYLEAAWGFKNHWYPALFSHELPEGSLRGVVIAGHEVALRRAKGKVYGLADQCIHRGVKISARQMCLNDEHLTCWYHGFCYGLEDGVLKTIVGSPRDPLIGRVKIRTYPLEERGGIIFVFIGDEDYRPVPPLTADLPIRITDDPNPTPHLLDENLFMCGVHGLAKSNWRLGAENAFDPGHVLIHWDNAIVAATDSFIPLGFHPTSPDSVKIIDVPDGPKGIMNMYYTYTYAMATENPVARIKSRGSQHHYVRTSFYLPGCLLVEHWPLPGMAIYGWYVPTDDRHHEYWDVAIARCNSEEERKDLQFKHEKMFKPLHFEDFYSNDIFAREAMQRYYDRQDGWHGEQLCELDSSIITWRKLASHYNRGIQEPPDWATDRG